jgi:UDP-N-acetylmuramoyl-tripeptide--D-alanyl-D-alanine ligase
MSRLTIADFIDLNKAKCSAGALAPGNPFIPSTDSRTLRAGETFVCLRGPHFDGHDFIRDAVRGGAIAVVVDERYSRSAGALAQVAAIVVEDTKRAYLAGATRARELAADVQLIGVTGSNGKTTTKEMAAQLVGRHRKVAATPANENNELGVAKLCYALDGVEVAIAEMGARHPGEIAELCDIAAPDIGVLTNVGEAHLEFFDDREQLARTKFTLLERSARAVCNAADAWTRRLAAETDIGKRAVWTRLCGDEAVPGLALEAGTPQGGRVALSLGASHAFASWHLVGEHHLRDALLAAAAALQCGLSLEQAIAGFGDLRLPEGRFEIHALPSGAFVVYDAYNASPTSVAHALRAFAELPARRRIAVLGSMAELGGDVSAQHEETGAAAARCLLNALYCGGDFAAALARGAVRAGMPPASVMTYSGNEEIAGILRGALQSGDGVLLKGSRVQRMEEILEALVAEKAAM